MVLFLLTPTRPTSILPLFYEIWLQTTIPVMALVHTSITGVYGHSELYLDPRP